MTAITAARHYFSNPAERRAYFAEEIRRMDEISVIEGNRREARAEGIAEGKTNAKERMVRTFLEKWPDMRKAAELLGLELKEVRRIASKFGLLPQAL